jgi:GATA-binding protein
MLRADPSDVEGIGIVNSLPTPIPMHPHSMSRDGDSFERGSPFPSSQFNFSFPSSYDGLFDGASHRGGVSSLGDYGGGLEARYQHHHQQHHSGRSSFSVPGYQSSVGSPPSTSEGLSAAAAAASAVMAESYARMNAGPTLDESGLDYRHLVGMMYPTLENPMQQGPFTHVDPTQILSLHGENAYPAYHHSPSSDGWGNGVNSSSNPSPEPYNTSNASTPPSAENASNSRSAAPAGRKYISLKHGSNPDAPAKKKSLSGPNASPILGELRSATSTPDPENSGGHAKSGSEEGDQTPILCTNCQTTNTPLWRRDPEGQPLCKSLSILASVSWF